jgi:hypothetical protein
MAWRNEALFSEIRPDGVDPVGAAGFGIPGVVGHFVPQEQADEQANGHAERQPEDVEDGGRFLPGEAAEGDF